MTFDFAATRARLRKETLERRDALPATDVAAWGARVAERAYRFAVDGNVDIVFSYLDVPNEVPTRSLVERLLRADRRVFVPYVTTGSLDLALYEVRDLDADLKRGIWGIPTPRVKRCPQRDGAEVELAFVPLVAFDNDGNRIGHGAGYYDRFLSKNPHVYRLGLAFETQRVNSCHAQPWDVPLDALITEEGLRTFGRR
jgi:5-formyltetrahydrofolate cyclo-ligase